MRVWVVQHGLGKVVKVVEDTEDIIIGMQHAENWYIRFVRDTVAKYSGYTNCTIVVELIETEVSPMTGMPCSVVGGPAVQRYVRMATTYKNGHPLPRMGEPPVAYGSRWGVVLDHEGNCSCGREGCE